MTTTGVPWCLEKAGDLAGGRHVALVRESLTGGGRSAEVIGFCHFGGHRHQLHRQSRSGRRLQQAASHQTGRLRDTTLPTRPRCPIIVRGSKQDRPADAGTTS